MSEARELSDNEYLFTSESVTEGHPDKIADQISDGVLDAVLADDPYGRVACETLVNTGLVVVSGEITTDTYVDIQELARDTITRIGYTDADLGFTADSCAVISAIDKQSPDIAQGVDTALEARTDPEDDDELDVAGAGDQGMMFGYATRETPELMPLPISLAHRLAHRLAEVRKGDVVPYLRPDGKTQVTVRYENGRPIEIEKILISTQHKDGVDTDTLIRPDLWEHVLHPILPAELYDPQKAQHARELPRQPDGPVRHRRTRRRRRPHRPQDHRRHLRGHGPPWRRRLLRQGPVEGGPLGGVRRALGGEERGRGRARRPLRGAGRLRDRRRPPGLADGRDVRHREDLALTDRRPHHRALRPPPGRLPRGAQPPPADLPEDGRLRPLRPRGPRLHLESAPTARPRCARPPASPSAPRHRRRRGRPRRAHGRRSKPAGAVAPGAAAAWGPSVGRQGARDGSPG